MKDDFGGRHCEEGKMGLPLVSVLMPCYNHGDYVGNAIESILNQTYPNIELIVADNGCTDNSFEIINRYRNRIKILQLEENNLRLCGKMLRDVAEGEFVAWATADDEWEAEKIQLQMAAFASIPNLQVCFTWALYADENMQICADQGNNVFLARNRSRAEWLRSFIYCGNCLCFPSVVLRKQLYPYLESVSRGYIQLSDFNFWISVIQVGEIYIVEKPMVKFRWHVDGENQNSSAPSLNNKIRTDQEYAEIVLYTMETVQDSFFKAAFGEEFLDHGAESHYEILCEKFFLLKRMAERAYCFSDIMLRFYYKYYLEMMDVLELKYGFNESHFADLAAENGLQRVCLLLDQNIKLTKAQGEYIDAYMRIAQVLAGEIYSGSGSTGGCGKAIFGMMPGAEQNRLRNLHEACTLISKQIQDADEREIGQYAQSVNLLVKLGQFMKDVQGQAKLLGIMCDEETFGLFLELVHLSESNRLDLKEAILPYVQMVAEQLGEVIG